MDPEFITRIDWHQIATALKFLWGFLGAMIVVGGSLILAHMVIPSLLASRQIPELWQEQAVKLRPLLYGAAMLALALAIFFLVSAINFARAGVHGIYPRWFQ